MDLPKIEEIWAWISDEGEGDEGIIAARIGDSWMPLVGADKLRIESLRDIAEETAKSTGRPVNLIKFSVREDMEVL